jgi:hypothetical protein
MAESNDTILAQVPKQIQTRLAWAFLDITVWNGHVHTRRLMEAKAGQPGRFEYDLRYGPEGAAARATLRQAQDLMCLVERHGHAQGIDPQAVYAAMNGPPAIEPEGAAVGEWKRPDDDEMVSVRRMGVTTRTRDDGCRAGGSTRGAGHAQEGCDP